MKRRSWTAKRRLALFEAHKGVCHLCGGRIDGTREAWDVEHIIPIAIGGDDDESNCAPAHKSCHKVKTRADAGVTAKCNRIRAKHNGAAKPKATIAGSRGTKFKRKINGEVVAR